MKKPLIFLAAVYLIASVSACSKCTSCSVYDSAGNAIFENRESCGNSDDRERAEREARDESALLGGTYECVDQD